MKNYHTHCNLCKHAKGKISDYVNSAINSGFTVLGFSDHAPTSNGLFLDMRMELSQIIEEYFNTLNQLKQHFKDIIDIKIGLECEYLEDSLQMYSDFLYSGTVDYLIGTPSIFVYDGKYINIHNLPQNESCDGLIDSYFKCLNNIANSKLFRIIGEPDLFYLINNDGNDMIKNRVELFVDLCKQNNKLIELNGLGIQRRINSKINATTHAVDLFWNIVRDKQAQVIIGSDAHTPEDISTLYCLAKSQADKYNLTHLVIDTYEEVYGKQ